MENIMVGSVPWMRLRYTFLRCNKLIADDNFRLELQQQND